MKTLIVVINALLAGAIVWAAGSALSPKRTRTAVVKRDHAKKTAIRKAAADGGDKAAPAMTREQAIATILSADMFNSERTPNASARGGGRLELTLVGTFEAGKIRGAVILQRSNNRQINPFMRMMWGGMGGNMPGAAGGAGARRFNFGAMMNGQGNNQRRGFNNGGNSNAIKQYVRLGETMPNGYTLVALSRTHATLTRGGDKMELELQNPSINQNASRRGGGAPRMNAAQQLQQAQLATQQMMVRALMDMRNQGGGGGGNRGGGTTRRGR